MEGLAVAIFKLALMTALLWTLEAASVSKNGRVSTLDLGGTALVSNNSAKQDEMLPEALPRIGIKLPNNVKRGSGSIRKPPPKPSRSNPGRIGEKLNDRSKPENLFREKKNRYSKEKVNSSLNQKNFAFGFSEIIYWIIAGVVGFLSMFFSFLCYVIRRMSRVGSRVEPCCHYHCKH